MNISRKAQTVQLIAYAEIFISTAAIAAIGILQGAGSGQVGDHVIGLAYFRPFTMDSNILAAFSSAILLIYGIRSLLEGKDSTPKWAVLLQLMSAACLALTMVIAACFLAPMEAAAGGSFFTMFSDDMFFFHLVNPLLSILSFTCLQKRYRLTRGESLLGTVPTVIYSVVYLVMVVFLKRWNDIYNFTFGGRYELVPLVISAVYLLILGLSLLLTAGHNKSAELN